MKNLLLILLLAPLVYGSSAFAQNKAGNWYFFWGYNTAYFSDSDIHFDGNFNGKNYDFTLDNVQAEDAPAQLGAVYLEAEKWLVPQYNYRFGYYLDEKHVISFGQDHMKYVMNANQVVPIRGTTVEGGVVKNYSGGDTKVLSPDFLQYEHTDGLNYFSVDLETYDLFWKSKSSGMAIYTMWGIGAGIVIPKSNVTLFNGKRNDEFHIAGTGISAKLAVQLDVNEDYFLRLTVKKGYMDLSDVKTTSGSSNKASQDFEFSQIMLAGGIMF